MSTALPIIPLPEIPPPPQSLKPQKRLETAKQTRATRTEKNLRRCVAPVRQELGLALWVNTNSDQQKHVGHGAELPDTWDLLARPLCDRSPGLQIKQTTGMTGLKVTRTNCQGYKQRALCGFPVR